MDYSEQCRTLSKTIEELASIITDKNKMAAERTEAAKQQVEAMRLLSEIKSGAYSRNVPSDA